MSHFWPWRGIYRLPVVCSVTSMMGRGTCYTLFQDTCVQELGFNLLSLVHLNQHKSKTLQLKILPFMVITSIDLCYAYINHMQAAILVEALSELTETWQLIFQVFRTGLCVGRLWSMILSVKSSSFFHSAPGVGFEVKPVLRWRCASQIWRLQLFYLGTCKEHW